MNLARGNFLQISFLGRSSSLEFFIGIIGFTGSQGVTGYTGSVGYVGSQGVIGFTGSQGIQGVIGFTGSQGIQGVIGFTGSKGDQGVIGFTGSQGIQGIIGFTGSQGDIGYTGSVGYVGSQGVIGFTGSQGIQGVVGFTGSKGDIGFTGSVGYVGSQGVIGFTGSQGDIGFTGSQGIQGVIGFTGSAGAAATIAVGTVTTGAPGSSASVTNVGTSSAAVFDITIPRGDAGAGTVTSVAALTLGTTGTDLSSSVANGTTTPVITLNVPTASATNRGVLSAADWITFNGKQAVLGFTPEDSANKGTAGGYAPLDGSAKIASTYLPSYVDDVLEYANQAAFPGTGETGKIYVALDVNKTFRWSGSAYVEISASPGSTDAVTEGSTNLYFLGSRVLATVLAGLSTASNTVVTASHTILQAIGFLQKQVSDLSTAIAQTVSIKDFGAVGDGVTDDTSAIQDALATGKDVFFPDGTYIVTGLTISNIGQTVYGNGGSSVLKLKNFANASVFTVSANCVTIKNLSIDGNKSNQTTTTNANSSGVWTTGVANLTVDGCNISSCKRNGIASSFSNEYCQYRNNRISDCDFIGIYNINSGFPLIRAVITGNQIQNCGQDGIGSAGFQHCTISNNVIKNCTVAQISQEALCHYTTISGNTLIGIGASDVSAGIQINDSVGITATGNNVYGCGYGTVAAGGSQSKSVAVTGNSYYLCGASSAVISVDAGAVANSFLNAYKYGVTVSGNVIGESYNSGILLNGVQGVTVEGNQIFNFATAATSMTSNRFLAGITLRAYSCYNNISNNYINDNASSALKAGIIEVNDGSQSPARNTIVNNTVQGVTQDVCILFSGNNASYVQRPITNGAAPTANTWARGQVQLDNFPGVGDYIGWVSTGIRGGSFGTFSTTGSITASSIALTLASTDGLFEGMSISITGAGGGGSTLNTTINKINRTTKVVDLVDPAGTTVSGAAVALLNPTFSTYGLIV
jgi:parallel beta-helix repeat protein